MGLADCVKCWMSNCMCGWYYRDFTVEALKKHIRLFESIIGFKHKFPDAKMSGLCCEETPDDEKFMAHLELKEQEWKDNNTCEYCGAVEEIINRVSPYDEAQTDKKDLHDCCHFCFGKVIRKEISRDPSK